METSIKTKLFYPSPKTEIKKDMLVKSNFWTNAENNRFGIIPILLVVIACMGGIAAAFGVGNDDLKLAMIVFPTIIALALTLAVSPMKVVIWSSSIAIIIDFIILIFK